MQKEIFVFQDTLELAKKLAQNFIAIASDALHNQPIFTVTLSGGSTPVLFFEQLALLARDFKLWDNVHFFWGDERCVPPENPESNFGVAHKMLFSKIDIPRANIHRIFGENIPSDEVVRYQSEMMDCIPVAFGFPRFDLNILGMGSDGHTASIFPDQMELMKSDDLCGIATHPETGQKRITLTGKVLNNAKQIIFLVSGSSKRDVLSHILSGVEKRYPADYISPQNGRLEFYVDKGAFPSVE